MTPGQAAAFTSTQKAITESLAEAEQLVMSLETVAREIEQHVAQFDQVNQMVLRREHVRLLLRWRGQVRPAIVQRVSHVLRASESNTLESMLDASLSLRVIGERDAAAITQVIKHMQARFS